MKICVKREDILRALNHVQSVVERRNTIPVLSNVKIATTGTNLITLNTTDLDISVYDECLAEVKEAGAITVSVITLYDIVRKATEVADVTIESGSTKDSVVIRVGSSEFDLPSISVSEFPNFEAGSYTHKFSIHSSILNTLLTKTRHAVSNEETRYYLNGIFLHTHTSEDGSKALRAVATDGHRLAKVEFVQPEGLEDLPGIIIPKKTVAEIIKVLEGFAGEVEVLLSDKKITFKIGSAVLSSKLIDGKFPDYERVIPKNNDKQLEVSRESLARSIDLVISISNDKTRAVTLNIAPAKLTICATSDVNGNARGAQEIAANYNSPDPITIGFNSKYILDSLSAIEGNNVKVTLSSGVNAVIAQDAAEENCMYVLMPMQV